MIPFAYIFAAELSKYRAQTESTITQGYLQPVKRNRHVILHVKGIFINVTGKCYLVLFHYLQFTLLKHERRLVFKKSAYRSVFISILAYATAMLGQVCMAASNTV